MENDLVEVREWLTPLSWLYGLGVGIRNALYDSGAIGVRRFAVPVIGVGNITCGGTGKTPHVEYIARLLSSRFKTAVLSRGYKRKSRGYILAKRSTPMEQIGDEPWQMRHKLRGVHVAVDEDRAHGIERLCADEKTRGVEAIVLDDAFQHRRVEPGLNILLVDYHRLITHDKLLPAGRLREPAENRRRANMVVVTKCPPAMTPMAYRVVQKSLDLRPFQALFFSRMSYGTLQGMWCDDERTLGSLTSKDNVFLLTGIGSPEQMRQDIERHTHRIVAQSYPDHHYFSAQDVRDINRRFAQIPEPKLAITTEKDATRLMNLEGLSPELREALYVLPIEVEVLRGEGAKMDKMIMDYVEEHRTDGELAR